MFVWGPWVFRLHSAGTLIAPMTIYHPKRILVLATMPSDLRTMIVAKLQIYDECYLCDEMAVGLADSATCQFCESEFAFGLAEVKCDPCGRRWTRRLRNGVVWQSHTVCSTCSVRQVCECTICGHKTTFAKAHEVAGDIACETCWAVREQVWCPGCKKAVSHNGYLRVLFRDDRPAMHAAMLVTHYRHEHVASHDRAWSNRRYAKAIPGYDYDIYKMNVNNRAKRQLIRAIQKHVIAGTYSDTAQPWQELVRAFGNLRDTDSMTDELIEKVLACAT